MLQFLAMGIGLMGIEMLYLIAMGFGMLLMLLIMMHIACPYIEAWNSWEEENQKKTVLYFGIFAFAMLVYYEPDSSLVAK